MHSHVADCCRVIWDPAFFGLRHSCSATITSFLSLPYPQRIYPLQCWNSKNSRHTSRLKAKKRRNTSWKSTKTSKAFPLSRVGFLRLKERCAVSCYGYRFRVNDDKTFTVNRIDTICSTASVGYVRVDGVPSRDDKVIHIGQANNEVSCRGFRPNSDTLRPFTFSRMILTGSSSPTLGFVLGTHDAYRRGRLS